VARTIQDAKLGSREARSRLAARGKPHYREIEPGLHLGYRKPRGRKGKPAGAGKWVERRYLGDQSYEVEVIGTADDFSDADGEAVLSFAQAQEMARERMVERAHAAAGKAGPFTVADAMDAYLEFLKTDGRSNDAIRDARYRDRAFIRPKLGELQVAALTAKKLKGWRDDLAKAPPRLRTQAGERQKHRELADDDDGSRARRASTNRTWTTLRAALNRAFANGDVPSDVAWRKVKPFRNVETARARYLTIAEAKRLVSATEPEFRPLIQAALLTGARYGQLAKLTVSDFNPDVGTLRLRTRKGDGSEKVYHVHLTDEGVRFFRQACGRAGGTGSALIFKRDGGKPWGKSHQARPVEEASERAKIHPRANFHITRHTFASHAVMNGTPLLVVAKSLGHADTRMVERVYGHLAPSYERDAIRAGAPRFGFRPDPKLATIDRMG
jgi:integrase